MGLVVRSAGQLIPIPHCLLYWKTVAKIVWKTWIENTRVRRSSLATLFCKSLVGCGFDDKIEGCGSAMEALSVEGLAPSGGVDFNLSGVAMPLPSGYMYRVRDDVLELIVTPGVCCDSGDWGVYREGFLQLQVHEGAAPEDPFRYFPNTHRGYPYEQISRGLGPFDYSFTNYALTWHVDAYFYEFLPPSHLLYVYQSRRAPWRRAKRAHHALFSWSLAKCFVGTHCNH